VTTVGNLTGNSGGDIMEIILWWSNKVKRNPAPIKDFMQLMLNRLIVGQLRYGDVNSSQNYLARLRAELSAYTRSGNAEQLINIANYAFLESQAPQNKKFHFDNTAGSATRKNE
jgi:hypothetical protein